MTPVYLLVGASSGIGAALAKKLVGKGIQLIALSRSESSLSGLSNVHHYPFDVLDESAQLPAVEGPISGLAYFPGTINLKPFKSLSIEDYRHEWEVNFLGAIRIIKGYLPNLNQSDTASILLMSSVAVQEGMPYHASTGSAKGAVESFMRSLAAELAPKIRVNALAPSLTETPLSQHLLSDEKKREHAALRHPMQRVGTIDDISDAAAFLLSDGASWITGQVLHVDGGISKLRLF